MPTDKQIAGMAGAARKRRLTVPCDEHLAGLSHAEVTAAFSALDAGRDYFAGHGCHDDGHEPSKHRATEAQAGRLFKITKDAGLVPLPRQFVLDNLSSEEIRDLCDAIEAGRDPLTDLRALAGLSTSSARPATTRGPSSPSPQSSAATGSASTESAVIGVLRDIAATLHRIADRLETH